MLLNFAKFVLLFLCYGYFQRFSGSGFVVGVLLGCYYTVCGYRWGQGLFLLYLASLYSGVEVLKFLSFLAISSFVMMTKTFEEDDTVVKFRPFEEKIRQFLLKTDPSALHKVDGWLDKYKNREEELYVKVMKKYEPKVPRHKPEPSPLSATQESRRGFSLSLHGQSENSASQPTPDASKPLQEVVSGGYRSALFSPPEPVKPIIPHSSSKVQRIDSFSANSFGSTQPPRQSQIFDRRFPPEMSSPFAFPSPDQPQFGWSRRQESRTWQ